MKEKSTHWNLKFYLGYALVTFLIRMGFGRFKFVDWLIEIIVLIVLFETLGPLLDRFVLFLKKKWRSHVDSNHGPPD